MSQSDNSQKTNSLVAAQKQSFQHANQLLKEGRLAEAESIYRQLITAETSNHFVYSNLAAICGLQGRLDELIALLRKALELEANYPEAHFSIAGAFMAKGNFIAAIDSYKCAIQLKKNYPEAFSNLGNALLAVSNFTEAIVSYKQAIKLNPNNPDTYNNLGYSFQQKGEIASAIASYHQALTLNPNHPDAHNNLGNIFLAKDNHLAAINHYNKALKAHPSHQDAQYNLGNALLSQGHYTAAISSYKKALSLNPNHPKAHNNIGNAHREQDDLPAAINSYLKALALNPQYIEAHYNLGVAQQESGNFAEAIYSYKIATSLDPNYSDAHWNYALTLLLSGSYKEGWDKYEWRTKKKTRPTVPHASPQCKLWDGTKLKKGSSLILVSEQGLGDSLQFIRYAAVLRNKGIDVSLCMQKKLHSLIQASGIDKSPLTPEQANEIKDGYWVPLLSVPKHLGVGPYNPITNNPYIKTTEQLTTKWAGIFSAEKRPIIGINWQGNPEAEETGLRGRSMELKSFAPIAENRNISLLSLQKGFGSEQMNDCKFKSRFVNFQEQVNDTWEFLETAAIVKNCDLIITTDTAMAHLAGSMGKPTWLLLKKIPDWRWGTQGKSTFWYPSMLLFRQDERGDWEEVMKQVANELNMLLDSDKLDSNNPWTTHH